MYETSVFGFDVMKNNWASVCSCGIGITYLYAFPERFNIVKDRIFSAMERYITRALGDDGYCSEGSSYWVYGFGFFTLFYDLYCQFTGERPAILDSQKVKNTIQFAKNSILDNGLFLPIADGGSKGEHNEAPILYVINRLFNTNLVLNNGREIEPDTQVLGTRVLCDVNNQPSEDKKEVSCVYFDSSQVLVRKKENYVFVAKGGNNAEMHNHNDLGAFSIVKNGKQYICDPGVGEYTNGYFNSAAIRYSKETFVCSSLGHSVPMIDGKTQKNGKEYFAKVIDRSEDLISFDLTNAYPENTANVKVIYETLEDGVKASYNVEGASDVTFRFVTFIEPKIDGKNVKIEDLTLSSNLGVAPEISRVDYFGFLHVAKVAYTIDYKVKDKNVNAKFNFEF